MSLTPHPSSFRDPDAEIVTENGKIFRILKTSYSKHYNFFMQSGLYNKLLSMEFIIPHLEVNGDTLLKKDFFKILRPQNILFVSYPYEWSFSQLKDAAMVTLNIQQEALEKGMTLKDANAFNIQFSEGKPKWIDTASFEIYAKNTPWLAYRQFCCHFLAPLVLILTNVKNPTPEIMQ